MGPTQQYSPNQPRVVPSRACATPFSVDLISFRVLTFKAKHILVVNVLYYASCLRLCCSAVGSSCSRGQGPEYDLYVRVFLLHDNVISYASKYVSPFVTGPVHGHTSVSQSITGPVGCATGTGDRASRRHSSLSFANEPVLPPPPALYSACTQVSVSAESGKISVWNDGAGIPIQMHKEHHIYVPELIFGNLLTGSNFDDDQKKTTGGRNGFGAKVTCRVVVLLLLLLVVLLLLLLVCVLDVVSFAVAGGSGRIKAAGLAAFQGWMRPPPHTRGPRLQCPPVPSVSALSAGSKPFLL